ncbi:MAG TPA: 50S ribosomal protein L9 [Sedimentisphaerales bacterium]|nr:50S ribosomal protein L9 [Sedimentisphaerales bacterium]
MADKIKVLLLADIENNLYGPKGGGKGRMLGWYGDVLEVSSGYARNYLLPQGLAVIPTQANVGAIAEEKARRSEQRIQERQHLERAVSAVNGAEAVLAAKANEQGHLFGSISAGQIAGNLRQQGFEVADDVVELAEHIKEVGTTQVTLRFAEDLTATVNVVVVADQDGASESGD